MAGIQLRAYQAEQIAETREAMRMHRRLIFQAPTSYGKGVVIGYMAAESQRKGSRILILSNRVEIFGQNAKHIRNAGCDCQYVNPQAKAVPTKSCVVAMSPTLKRRLEKEEWREWIKTIDLVIIDEAHEAISDEIHNYLNIKCFVIGFTATPVRYTRNQRQLGELYSAIVVGPSVQELIDMCFLTPAKHFAFSAPLLEDVSYDARLGDFDQKQLASKFQSNERYDGILSNYQKICPNAQTVCFCVSSQQAISLCKRFCDAGIPSAYLLSGNFEDTDKQHSGERKQIIKDFNEGRLRVIFNVGILVSGFDSPNITCCILAFSTVSVAKLLQCLGRAARIAPSKPFFYALDFGSNFKRLGLYHDKRDWHLWHSVSEPNGIVPLRGCPTDEKSKDKEGKIGCGKSFPVQAARCPFCQWIVPTKDWIREVELEEIKSNSIEYTDLQQWAADKRLSGWSNNRILVSACIANKGHERKTFLELIKILRGDNGEFISPAYWHPFSKLILSKTKVKKA